MLRSVSAQAGARLEARSGNMHPRHAVVVTLLAGPGAEPALSDTAAALAATLGVTPDWLAPGRACDLVLDGDAPEAAEAAARQAIAGAPIDVLVQPAAGRRKRLFVADLESTII